MVNLEWLTTALDCTTHFLAPSISDHSPMLLKWNLHSSSPKPFRFNNKWIFLKDYDKIISEAWEIPVEGNPMYKLISKVKNTKEKVKTWLKFNPPPTE